MRIGLFGGTFDPIHWGHLRSAEEVKEALSLDRVIFIPASIPPHKKRQPTTSPLNRLRMVRLATARNPRFAVSDIEHKRAGKSFSIDTIRYFVEKEDGHKIYFILGLDAFQDIDSWKDVQSIFPLCHLIVTSRPGSGDTLSLETIPVAVRSGFCYDSRTQSFRHMSGTRLYFTRITDINISASDIRSRLKKGKSIRYLVPREVEAYIEKQGLYVGRRGGRSRV